MNLKQIKKVFVKLPDNELINFKLLHLELYLKNKSLRVNSYELII